MGLHRAGFDVFGIDIKPQPRYPFPFIRGDALKPPVRLEDFDLVWASPPCQRYSSATKRNGTQLRHPDLIPAVRSMLQGLHYVIENVESAPLVDALILCGGYFNLQVDGYRLRRHRAFEASFDIKPRMLCVCALREEPVLDVTGGGPTSKPRPDARGGRPHKGTASQCRRIMGMPWATKSELNEAIPPAYSEHIGRYAMMALGRA